MTFTIKSGIYGNNHYLEICQDKFSTLYKLYDGLTNGTEVYSEKTYYYSTLEKAKRAYARKRKQYILERK